jgi:hypothetical protein
MAKTAARTADLGVPEHPEYRQLARTDRVDPCTAITRIRPMSVSRMVG